MNPCLAACQLVNVSRAGEAPGLWDAPEDVTLMLPGAVGADGKPLDSDTRRKWCDNPANLKGAVFEPGYVYTIHSWQHYADFGDYRLSLVREVLGCFQTFLGGWALIGCVGLAFARRYVLRDWLRQPMASPFQPPSSPLSRTTSPPLSSLLPGPLQPGPGARPPPLPAPDRVPRRRHGPLRL
jgi:hypothetical protein